MNHSLFKKWCDQWWLYVVYILGLCMCLYLFLQWNILTIPQRLMGILSIFISIHIYEENTFPGGFFYMMNLVQKSPMPLRYPMNTVQDMFTNFIAMVLTMFLTFIDTTHGMLLLVCFFGIGESLAHTLFGVLMYRQFKENGKKSIYGPGSISAYILMLPLSIYSIMYISNLTITQSDWLTGFGLLFFIIIGLIRIPQMISNRLKSPNYEFKDAEYFQKFL